MDAGRFRSIIGSFATGVTLVTTRDGEGRPAGLTVNAVASVSLDPVLVLVCLDRASRSHDLVLVSEVFAISVLDVEQEELSRRFAGDDREERFSGVRTREAVTGSPVLSSALAWLDCRVWKTVPAGDHTVVVGEVVAGGVRSGSPLLFFRGDYRRIGP